MSHLPECFCTNPNTLALSCICDRLRAAEQRAVDEFRSAMNEGTQYLAGQEYGYEQSQRDANEAATAAYLLGQRDAIAKAVSAVEALYVPGWPPTNDQVIAAIKAVQS